MPTIYENEQEMLDGANGGIEDSIQLVLVQPTSAEEVGVEITPPAVVAMLGMPMQHLQLFDGRRLLVHAPQYHCNVTESSRGSIVDQEARERIVSLVDLLDGFGRHTKAMEEELWACTK